MRAFLLLFLCPLLATAQPTGKLAGRVVDDLGDPLPGANITIGGTQIGTSADTNGDYFVIGIPPGRYAVTASFVSYHAITDTVDVTPSYTVRRDFELESEWRDRMESCIPDSSYRPESSEWQDFWLSLVHPIADAYGLPHLDNQVTGDREARIWWIPPWGSTGLLRLVWSEDKPEGSLIEGWPLQSWEGQSLEESEVSLANHRDFWRARCGPFLRGETAEACAATFTRKPKWKSIAPALEKSGLWTLPDESVLPDLYEHCGILSLGFDGQTYIVELFDGFAYRAYHYWEPDADSPWPEERQAAGLVQIMRGVYDSVQPPEH